jgi:hypothetical protein
MDAGVLCGAGPARRKTGLIAKAWLIMDLLKKQLPSTELTHSARVLFVVDRRTSRSRRNCWGYLRSDA